MHFKALRLFNSAFFTFKYPSFHLVETCDLSVILVRYIYTYLHVAKKDDDNDCDDDDDDGYMMSILMSC